MELLFGPIPAAVENAFAQQMIDFYINFVNDLNPGGSVMFILLCSTTSKHFPTTTAQWPAYSLVGTRQVMQLMRDNVTMIPDGMFVFD